MKKRTLGSISLALAVLFSGTFQISPAQAADAQINSIVKRLNSRTNLWQINTVASSSAGTQSRQRLGLYQQPNAVIECNLRMSGTWLFVYKSTDQGYKAASSNYFVRTNYYDVEIMIDPRTDYIVLVHTSMGGNQQCLNSAYKVLSYITD
jgi:hypothetical protein